MLQDPSLTLYKTQDCDKGKNLEAKGLKYLKIFFVENPKVEKKRSDCVKII